jgi:hypothetical protein
MGASYGKQKDAVKRKGKIDGRFTAIPHNVIFSVGFRKLSHAARALLFDIAGQYNGKNNGALVACTKYLKPLGWNSNDTITKALKQLEEGGLLIKTKQGMRPPMAQPSLYALGWLDLQITAGLDISPKSYQRSAFVPAISKPILKHKKMITPINGAAGNQITPITGIDATPPAPIAGAVEAQNEQKPIPIVGEFIYIPSTPAPCAGDAPQVIH